MEKMISPKTKNSYHYLIDEANELEMFSTEHSYLQGNFSFSIPKVC